MAKPLCMFIAAFSVLSGTIATSSHAVQLTPSTEQFYVSLGYGPVISKISGFRIGTNGQTKWVFPYHERRGTSEMRSENFFWSTDSYPGFQFQKHSSGYKGAVGYAYGNMRLEMEMDHVKFKIVPTGRQKQTRGGSVPFALGKEITVMSTYEDTVLSGVLPKFSSRSVSAIVRYLRDPSFIGADKVDIFQYHANLFEHIVRHLTGMEEAVSQDERANHEVQLRRDGTILDSYLSNVEDADSVITRAIAMGAEGAEIVELTAVSNTTITANLCYDFPLVKVTKFGFFPYTCAGLGSGIIGVAEGHVNAQFSYKIKLGLDYNVTPCFTVYAGAVYSGIKGIEYDRIPVKRLVDDISHYSNSSSDTSASFRYSTIGIELGSRMLF